MACVKYVFTCAFILFATVNLGAAIDCYECNSVTDKRCIGDEKNKLDQELLKPCPTDKTYFCRKIKQIIEFEVNGLGPDNRIIRMCGWYNSTYDNRCYQRSGFGGRQEVCACDKDGCNAANGVTLSLVAILLLILARFV